MSQAEPFSSRHHLTLELECKAPLFSHNPHLPPLGLDLITSSQLTPSYHGANRKPRRVLGSTLPAHTSQTLLQTHAFSPYKSFEELQLKPIDLAAQVGGLLSIPFHFPEDLHPFNKGLLKYLLTG